MQNRKKKLDFTPFSQADVNALLAAVPSSDGKIRTYKVNIWFDKSNNSILYGIACQSKEGTWFNMCDGKRAIIFDDKKLANKVCREFKKSLSVAVA